MKKLAIMMLAVMAVAIPLLAQDQVTPAVSGLGVNIRSGPGIDYALRGGLNEGSLTITGRNEFDTSRICHDDIYIDLDMWLQVDYNGVEGWVALCAVKTDADLASIPVVSPANPVLTAELDYSSQPEALTLGDIPENFVYGVTRARVNLREGAGLDHGIIRELRGGEMLYVVDTEVNNQWVKVEVGDLTGWVARYLVSMPSNWQELLAQGS